MLNTKEKAKIIKKYQAHETDSGSASVQIALISKEIKELSSHLKKHPKDNHSRRGLLKMVSRRRKLLSYLKENDSDIYEKVIQDLNIKK